MADQDVEEALTRSFLGRLPLEVVARLRSEGVGDLTYGAELLERRQVPGVGNRRRLAEITGKVLALKKQMPGLVILPAHDPTAAARLLGT